MSRRVVSLACPPARSCRRVGRRAGPGPRSAPHTAASGERALTKYGFVIDHRKCIGCHACTVACKSENNVPLGAFRTWVKYIEKGEFPNTRRFFTVERCQHCEAAPCVTI